MTNSRIAELLALEGEKAEGQMRMALKRAARRAFLWPEEAANLVKAGRSLTELAGIGPFLAAKIEGWLEHAPAQTRPPPQRDQFLSLTEARQLLRKHPDWTRLYRGDLQMHSEWSDGAASISAMAEAARLKGYEYIAITDHSKGLKIAGGIDERELAQQQVEIDQLNADLKPFRIFRSIELNLNPRGEADMDAGSLKSLDLVLGSFHSALRRKEEQTSRYIAALENKAVHILGHPRGRIYNFRLGLNADWPQVFGRAAKLGKALEIDSYPDRQDLSVGLLRLARQEGVLISINTDAHAPEQLGFVEFGLAAALQARIPAERIVNFWPAEQLLCWVKNAGRSRRTGASVRRLGRRND